MRFLISMICLLMCASATGQVLVPIQRAPQKKPGLPATQARTMNAQSLPFWDDFSDTNGSVPRSELWFAGQRVTVSTGLGINPPSIRVATFDGIDSTGRPYSVNEVLAKGFADKLESQPILMEEVDLVDRNSVYLSFFYQIKGRGETPDVGDVLTLWFRDNTGTWEQVWIHENEGTEPHDEFFQVIIPVTDPKYFHNNFQFRFQNFARLSGPYDTWHVDYIYLNKGRSETDLSYPDRTLTAPLTSLFGMYHAMPIKHFRVYTDALKAPRATVTNLRLDQVRDPNTGVGGQSMSYFSEAQVTTFSGGVSEPPQNVVLDVNEGFPAVESKEVVTFPLKTLPDRNLITPLSDSALIKLRIQIATKDNVDTADVEEGDYIAAKYAPIDFRHNDTTSTTYSLVNYYAYDDGSAEYGAGLNQPGAQVAYQFNLLGANTEYVTNVGFYFPRFGDETSQVIELRIWNGTLENADSLVHKEVISIQRTDNNTFVKRALNKPVAVGKKFFVGWRQSSAAIIAVGLDKNNDSGNRMFFNVDGTWAANTQIAGSLMIRPYFGEGIDEDTTGFEEEQALAIYPNPSDGVFTVAGDVEQLLIRDLAGRTCNATIEKSGDETRVTMNNPSPGVYIVSVLRENRISTTKIIVR